ncbi:MAG: hypothetical protein VBE63_07755 [Lamprobacter sp.]|uniref:hypothetical protein n=1 Tax=Lamprobacter sp. TaxID=3100796 RepID=UPI002B256E28|nr:hypothetical protein [Lamprobacter sp.]MEA3639824.1 hypothetical protein [Lamprobacter sp.]
MNPATQNYYLKYTWKRMDTNQPGLGHMSVILKCLIYEAKTMGRIPILPPLYFNPIHNRGVAGKTNWNLYFTILAECADESDLNLRESEVAIVEGGQYIPQTLIEDNPRCICKAFGGPSIFGQWLPESWRSEAKGFLGFSNESRVIGQNIVKTKGCFRFGMHIRRNDVADSRTSPKAVMQFLRQNKIPKEASIFVCSDERDLAYWKNIQNCYPNVLPECQIPELEEIWEKRNDNYLIYRTAQYIRQNLVDNDLGQLRFLDAHKTKQASWPRRTIQSFKKGFGKLIFLE